MKNKNLEHDPLDPEEQWYENHADDFKPADNSLRQALIDAAKTTAKKSERINIRMTKPDVEQLKSMASREGIPYQTLLTSIIHKYTEGLLVDIREARKLFKEK